MIVQGEILKTNLQDSPKGPIGVVLFEVDSPSDVLQLRIWAKQVSDGKLEPFKKLQGKIIQVSLQPEVYNGRLSYSLFMGGQPVEVKQQMAPALAAAK